MHRIAIPMAAFEAAMLTGVAALLLVRHRRALHQPLRRVDIGHGGAPTVFLHGLGATHRYWLRPLEDTPPPGRITLIDLLGFGDSPQPWFRHTVDRHVERLHARLAGEQDMTLVGHSLGAALALAYAARHPGQVRRLVLLSLPYFGGESEAYRWLRQTPEGWIFTNVALMTLACVVTRRVLSALLPYLRPDLPREVAQDAVKHSWMASTTSLWDVVYRHDLRQDADALGERIPVVCIHGARDMTVPARSACRLAAGRANWLTLVLPGTDHHPWLREPQACRELIFGSRVPASAASGLHETAAIAATASAADPAGDRSASRMFP